MTVKWRPDHKTYINWKHVQDFMVNDNFAGYVYFHELDNHWRAIPRREANAGYTCQTEEASKIALEMLYR